MPTGKKFPKPGPAKLSKSGYNDIDEWLKCAFNNQYLPEAVMKKLCEICKEYLMEGGASDVLSKDIHLLMLSPNQNPIFSLFPPQSPSAVIFTANSMM